MNEIIKIEQKNGIETVNARELHEFLESKYHFSDWIKSRIEKYGFEENTDFVKVSEKIDTSGGVQSVIQYHISIDMAKQLSMVENNKKGIEARKYFINCEKALKTVQGNIEKIVSAEIKKQLKGKTKQIQAPSVKVIKEYMLRGTWVKLVEFKGNKYQVMRNFYNHEKCDLRYNDREYGSLIKAGFLTVEKCFSFIERNL